MGLIGSKLTNNNLDYNSRQDHYQVEKLKETIAVMKINAQQRPPNPKKQSSLHNPQRTPVITNNDLLALSVLNPVASKSGK